MTESIYVNEDNSIPVTEQEKIDRETPLTRDELITLTSLVMSRLAKHTLHPGVFVDYPNPDFVRENRILIYKLNGMISTDIILEDYHHKEII